MTADVSHLLQQAMQLSSDMRMDLAEQLMESAAPSQGMIAEQMKTVRERMQNVESGASELIVAEEAHRYVLNALAAKA